MVDGCDGDGDEHCCRRGKWTSYIATMVFAPGKGHSTLELQCNLLLR